jgi:dTDP-4-amino-4,6-dideoxygalactose transaminase
MPATVRARYEQAFARQVGSAHACAFWKGRVAMYAILKGLGVGVGDEVIIPGYTCVMAVNPVMYLGAKPVYADIEPETYNIDPALIERHITGSTKVIVAQHTYGYPAQMAEIEAIASDRGIPIVEDCCLALGSTYRGRSVGTFGAAAYWSSQWNKPYTTGLGGVATTSDPELAGRIKAIQRTEAVQPSFKQVAMLGCQLAVYRALVYPRTTALAQTVFRSLTKAGLVVGSSGNEEFDPSMPDEFLKGMSDFQARVGLRQLQRLDRAAEHRKRMARVYDELLAARGWPVPHVPADTDPVLVRYPVRVRDKQAALRTAAKHLVEVGSWFECPLHPIETPLEHYGYSPGLCPVAERACAEVVNLPVHPRANEAAARRTVEFIARIGPATYS